MSTVVERWNFKAAQVDMIGQRFGRLVVTGRVASDGAGRSRWRCRCDCGGERVTLRQTLIRGDANSCGCLRRKREPLPSHLHRGHSQPTQQQRAGSSSAARQSFDEAWRDCVARADATLDRVRQRVRWA